MIQVIITSSVLILILIGLRYLMRGRISQRLQYALWLLAALRLLLPFQIGTSSISISNLTNDTSKSVTQMMEQPVRQIQATPVEEQPREDQPVQTPVVDGNTANDVESVPPVTAPAETVGSAVTDQTPNTVPVVTPVVTPATQAAETREPLTVGQVLQIIWLSGVGLMALWFLGVNLIYNRRVRRSAEPWAVEGSPVPVMVSDAIQSPCLLGFFRPRVYLTMACASDPEATRHVLAHELTHYRHGDLLWSVVRSACLCLHWYNPLVWWAASLSRRDCELACDEGALRKLG
ncbi:MAG: peptidase M56, partial [Oscillospiraceae bacterium]|nr:peptidase M56 [Oscillospiraceae bacterium]